MKFPQFRKINFDLVTYKYEHTVYFNSISLYNTKLKLLILHLLYSYYKILSFLKSNKAVYCF